MVLKDDPETHVVAHVEVCKSYTGTCTLSAMQMKALCVVVGDRVELAVRVRENDENTDLERDMRSKTVEEFRNRLNTDEGNPSGGLDKGIGICTAEEVKYRVHVNGNTTAKWPVGNTYTSSTHGNDCTQEVHRRSTHEIRSTPRAHTSTTHESGCAQRVGRGGPCTVVLTVTAIPVQVKSDKDYLKHVRVGGNVGSRITDEQKTRITVGDMQTLGCSNGDQVIIRKLSIDDNSMDTWESATILLPANLGNVDLPPAEVVSTILSERWVWENGQSISLPTTSAGTVVGEIVCRRRRSNNMKHSQSNVGTNTQKSIPSQCAHMPGDVQANTLSSVCTCTCDLDATKGCTCTCLRRVTCDECAVDCMGSATNRHYTTNRLGAVNRIGTIADATRIFVCVEGVAMQQRGGFAVYLPPRPKEHHKGYLGSEIIQPSTVNFATVHQLLKERMGFSNGPSRTDFGFSTPANILLSGDAGIGKTVATLSYSLNTLQVPVVVVSMSTMAKRRWNAMITHPLSASIKDAFHAAEQLSECVLLLDDLDALVVVKGAEESGVPILQEQLDLERVLVDVLKRNEYGDGNVRMRVVGMTQAQTAPSSRVAIVSTCRSAQLLRHTLVSCFTDTVHLAVPEVVYMQGKTVDTKDATKGLLSSMFPQIYDKNKDAMNVLANKMSDAELMSVHRVYKSLVAIEPKSSGNSVNDTQIPTLLTQAFERVRQPQASASVERVTWDDISGLQEVKTILEEAVLSIFKNAAVFDRLGAEPVKGILLHGPPGTGKTMIAKAIAGQAGVGFVSMSIPSVVHGEVGESEKALVNAFTSARKAAPCVLFFDEIQAIFGQRSQESTDRNLVTQLLMEMDSLSGTRGVVVVAATNVPTLIDPSLLRPGRMDEIVYVPPPDALARRQIFKGNLDRMGDKCTISVDDLDDLVARTEGFTGADLANVCKQAALVGLKRAWSTWTPDFGETEDDMEYNEHTPSETTQDAARGNRENNLEGNREGEVVMDESKGDMIGAKSELANTRSGMSLGDDVAIREQDSVAGTSGSKVGKRLPVADYTSAHNDHSQKSGANLFYGSKLPDLRVTKEDILCALEQCSPSVSADMLQMHVDWQAKHQRAS